MIKTRFLLLAFFFALVQVAWSQTISVSGTVSDENGITLPGVNVIEEGTSNGVSTDIDGNYQISVQSGATLVFSYVGFIAQEIPVSGREVINVTLLEDLQDLEEVVVIGYGTQLKEDISGSVSSIDADDLSDIPQVSIDQLMQGRAAGVMVTQDSGQPGGSVSVRIRGVTSLQGSNEPLYVIDGVPVSGDTRNVATSGRGVASSTDIGQGMMQSSTGVSPLSSINPNDIESIDILKDASATAIYGSRASNGVVIITTKKGRSGRGKLTYNTYMAIQQPSKFLDVLDLPGYAVLQNEINELYGLPVRLEFLRPELLGPGTDWQDELFKNAVQQNHQISFSGGKDGTNFFLSAGYTDQQGIIIGSEFDRITLRANVNSKINDWISVGAAITASRTNEDLIMNNSEQGAITLALTQNPSSAVYNADGSFAGPNIDDDFMQRNPIADILSRENNLLRNRLLGNLYAEFTLFEGLKYRTEFGGDFGNTMNDRFQSTYEYGEIVSGTNILNVRRENNDFWVIKNLLTFNKNFNDRHDLTVLLGQEAQESTWEGVITQGSGFVNNSIRTLNLADPDQLTVDHYKGSSAIESYFGRAIYQFDDRYSITASLRADGSSKFAEGNKWGYFPAVSVAWNLSNESFMDDVTFMENIRFKAGYGEVGNQGIDNFAYGARLQPVSSDLGTGFLFANAPNPDLIWESATQTNIGVEFSLLESRLRTSIEVYDKTSKDFLYRLALMNVATGGGAPGSIGAPYVNLGEMQNRGIDVEINYNTIGGGDFSWNSTLTLSHYQNEVTQLINGGIPINQGFGGITITQTKVGEPLGLFYGLEVEGLFRTMEDIEGAPIQYGRPFENAGFSNTWLGDIKFKDQNGDGVVNDEDRVVIGNPHPDFIFGFNNQFSYKNVDLTVFLQGSYGNDIFNALGRNLTAANRTYTNQLASTLDFWSVDNPDASAPRPARNDTRNIDPSDRYVEDGSYLRVQNVTLGYNFPSDLVNKFGVYKLKLYGSVQNLYTFTKYSGLDPDVGSVNQNALLMGVDNGRYPVPRTITFGLNVEF